MTQGFRSRTHSGLLACAALFGLATALVAQTPAAPPAPTTEWKTYSYSSDGFSVLVPSEPKLAKQSVPTGAGSFELRSYLVEIGSAALYVGVVDYGQAAAGRNPDTILQGAKTGAIDNVKAHIISEGKITLGVYPGVQFEAENDTLHFSGRIFLVGTSLYQTLGAWPIASPYTDSTRFLNSFQLIPRTAN